MLKNEQNKIVFESKIMPSNKNARVLLTDEAVDVINAIQLRTGLSATEIASKLVVFASKYVEIKKSMFD